MSQTPGSCATSVPDGCHHLELSASADESATVTGELLGLNADRAPLNEPARAQDDLAGKGAQHGWAARYTTPEMTEMAAKARALSDRSRHLCRTEDWHDC